MGEYEDTLSHIVFHQYPDNTAKNGWQAKESMDCLEINAAVFGDYGLIGNS
jgi:hypothetical protein